MFHTASLDNECWELAQQIMEEEKGGAGVSITILFDYSNRGANFIMIVVELGHFV